MKYYIIAGEASGDLHGGDLIKGLKQADPTADIRAWGGDRMSANGATLVKHYKDAAVMGFVEVLLQLPKVWRNIRFCKRDMLAFRPDAVILIDYPGFNFRMARFAKKHGLKVFYYIAPKVWAWKERRVKRLQQYVDKLFVIFPFEKGYFRKWGIEAFYAGNPLVDTISERLKATEPAAVFRQRNRLPEKPVIAILPGSRRMEINYVLPRVIPLAERFPDYRFVVAGAPAMDREIYEKYLRHTALLWIENQTYELLSHATAAIVASGTATLETALIGTPQIVCYGGNEISFQIAKRLVKIKFISLVNIIMGREVVPELIQHGLRPENLQAELQALLPNGSKRAAQLNGYAELRRLLGEQGAAKRIAQAMAEELGVKN
ncbi:MAG: lipid-A-disaccharide synthase [Prevotellaceae bacterium]|jgi:lipid-A-disaccharide synthase|nr:lipid-A-disaccharide synthase [Prevotellaceae bacterium]